MERMREGLFDCASEVLFFEEPGSGGTRFHPRCMMQTTQSFEDLDENVKQRVDELYVDYFYRRQEEFWQAKGYEKLPVMRRASEMLLCGEDLGMVPACVPGVLKELGILSLEIQRMPKSSHVEFSDPAAAPYLSVVSPSTHDMPTLRGWWREDPQNDLEVRLAGAGDGISIHRTFRRNRHPDPGLHLQSPAMWTIIPLQDLLAMDERLRHADPDAERINVPAIMPYYWRYRMHWGWTSWRQRTISTRKLARLLRSSGRCVVSNQVIFP